MCVESASANREQDSEDGLHSRLQPQSNSVSLSPRFKQQQREHLFRQLQSLQERLNEKFMPKGTSEEKSDHQKEGKT